MGVLMSIYVQAFLFQKRHVSLWRLNTLATWTSFKSLFIPTVKMVWVPHEGPFVRDSLNKVWVMRKTRWCHVIVSNAMLSLTPRSLRLPSMNSLGLRCVSIATYSIYIVMALCMHGLFQVVKIITIFLLVTGLVIPSMPDIFCWRY